MSGTIVLVLAVVFGAAGVAKVRGRDAFRAGLRRLVPAALVGPAAVGVPAAEVALAAWLASGLATRAAAWTSAALLVLFSVVLMKMWRVGAKGCGCFGEQAEGGGAVTGMVRNAVLIAGAVAVAIGPRDVRVFESSAAGLFGQASVVLGAACLWACAASVAARWKWVVGRRVAV
jgi:uncharacterized membrane protein YphA (DoxX/SURF4 family)